MLQKKQKNSAILEYLSIDNLKDITNECNMEDFCMGCFTGKYPIEVPDEVQEYKFDPIKL